MLGTGATADFEDGYEWRALRTKRYTYAQYLIDGKELKQNLKREMFRKMKEIGDSFEKCSYYREHWIEDRVIKHTATLQ